MYDLSSVKSAPLTFGTSTAGTASSVSQGTSTTNAVLLPRGNYSLTVQAVATVTATGTASSTQAVSGIATLQASNDNVVWFAVSTSTILVTAITSATFAAAGITTASANGAGAITVSANAYAYGRAIVASTGTSGFGYVFFGS